MYIVWSSVGAMRGGAFPEYMKSSEILFSDELDKREDNNLEEC